MFQAEQTIRLWPQIAPGRSEPKESKLQGKVVQDDLGEEAREQDLPGLRAQGNDFGQLLKSQESIMFNCSSLKAFL